MKLILAIIRPFKLTDVVDAIESDPNFPGMTVLDCRGFGREKTTPHRRSPEEELVDFVDRKVVLIAAPGDQAEAIVRRIEQVAHTGQPGDGKVVILPLEEAVRITTGQTGEGALR